jgi:hypothetical protein
MSRRIQLVIFVISVVLIYALDIFNSPLLNGAIK